MVYKCPVKACDEEFDDKPILALHLDSQHPQYGSACAFPVQPTVSLKTTHFSKLPCSNGESEGTNSPTALFEPAAALVTPKTRVGPSFYFHANSALRLARRLCSTSPSTSRKRRLFRRTASLPQPPNVDGLKAVTVPRLKGESAPLQQTCFSKIGARNEDRAAAAERLHACTKSIPRSAKESGGTFDEVDCTSKYNR